jgi:hypothetical protein
MLPAGNYMPVDVPPVYAATVRPPWMAKAGPAVLVGFNPRSTEPVKGWALQPGEEERCRLEKVAHERILRPHWATCPAADEFRREASPATSTSETPVPPGTETIPPPAAPGKMPRKRPSKKLDPNQGRLF